MPKGQYIRKPGIYANRKRPLPFKHKHPRKQKSIRQRFEEKIMMEPMSGCWLFIGAWDEDGYGKMTIDKRPFKASRVAYELYKGPIPEGMNVCHHCDTNPCCNPRDLFLGSIIDNQQDSVRKGRHYNPCCQGIKHGRSKLVDEQILCIREDKRHLKVIALEYRISESHVRKIQKRMLWKHLE